MNFNTRTGVYGIVMRDGQMLLIWQKSGPYTGKLDFPGGGIEFGETPEQTLRREFVEEVAMEFDSLQLIDNLTVTFDGPSTSFFHIGMIYQIDTCRPMQNPVIPELRHTWVDPSTLSEEQCSPLLWKYLSKLNILSVK